jgi:hypothetical protein
MQPLNHVRTDGGQMGTRDLQPIQDGIHGMLPESRGRAQARPFSQCGQRVSDFHTRTPKRFKRGAFIEAPRMPTGRAVIASLAMAEDVNVAPPHFLEIPAPGIVTPLLFECHGVVPPRRKHTPILTFRHEGGTGTYHGLGIHS